MLREQKCLNVKVRPFSPHKACRSYLMYVFISTGLHMFQTSLNPPNMQKTTPNLTSNRHQLYCHKCLPWPTIAAQWPPCRELLSHVICSLLFCMLECVLYDAVSSFVSVCYDLPGKADDSIQKPLAINMEKPGKWIFFLIGRRCRANLELVFFFFLVCTVPLIFMHIPPCM